jgi:hypothetical protein
MDYPKITSGLVTESKYLLICELITRKNTWLSYLIRILVET